MSFTMFYWCTDKPASALIAGNRDATRTYAPCAACAPCCREQHKFGWTCSSTESK